MNGRSVWAFTLLKWYCLLFDRNAVLLYYLQFYRFKLLNWKALNFSATRQKHKELFFKFVWSKILQFFRVKEWLSIFFKFNLILSMVWPKCGLIVILCSLNLQRQPLDAAPRNQQGSLAKRKQEKRSENKTCSQTTGNYFISKLNVILATWLKPYAF